jgi:hypothetical protein
MRVSPSQVLRFCCAYFEVSISSGSASPSRLIQSGLCFLLLPVVSIPRGELAPRLILAWVLCLRASSFPFPPLLYYSMLHVNFAVFLGFFLPVLGHSQASIARG